MMLVGIACFMLGIKLMSDTLKAGAGRSIKKAFAKIGDNRLYTIGIGTAGTVALQSSTTTTVMVVGFVNAGVMTLLQASAIMVGANVGTTLTAFLASIPVNEIFYIFGFFGIFMYMFAKKPIIRQTGKIAVALAILFLGLWVMGRSLRGGYEFVPTDTYVSGYGYLGHMQYAPSALESAFTTLFTVVSDLSVGPLLLVIFGALLTALIQSSSAVTLIIIGLYTAGTISLPAVMMVLLGSNIGTTFTAIIASIGSTKNAKRAALFHLIYNLIGAVIFLPILWPLQHQIAQGLLSMSGDNIALAPAFFHLFYNVGLMLVLLLPLPYIVKLITKIIPGADESETLKLEHINDSVEPSIETAILEISSMGEIVRGNMQKAIEYILSPDIKEREAITLTEQRVNFINKGVQNYLAKMPTSESNKLHMPVSELERIGDYAMELLAESADMQQDKIKFSESAVQEIRKMAALTDEMFEKSMIAFNSKDIEKLPEIKELEEKISNKKTELSYKHLKRLNLGECSVEGGVHFYAIVSCLERVSDFLAHIAFSIKGTKRADLARLHQLNKQNSKRRKSGAEIYW